MHAKNVSKFHGKTSSNNAHYMKEIPGLLGVGAGRSLLPNLSVQQLLRYQFSSHVHPYPDKLIKRLTEDGLKGLQDADTEYKGTPLPQSTRVKMDDGKRVTLPDGISVRLNGDNFTLPSTEIMQAEEGSILVLLDDVEIPFLNGIAIKYPAGTEAKLIGVKPEPELFTSIFTENRYIPSELVHKSSYPVKDLDFSHNGGYSVYNWELFYHVPLTIAIHLSKNQRFEESMRWFHYIFDPTDDSDGDTPERFWKTRPFQHTEVRQVEEILLNLVEGTDPDLQKITNDCVDALMEKPFRPHLVARYRQTPYMIKAVTAYLDNLIAWGDTLFRQDSRESINEATQLYVLAANILGERPQAIPKKRKGRPQTYATIREDLKKFGMVKTAAEELIPFDIAASGSSAADITEYETLQGLGETLYFCVPYNDRLLSYWDTVADRLFKIHNSLNIQGIFRQLPLFAPPIDPALLAKAAAAGLDVGAIAGGLNQPLPLIRFRFLVQKAAEICQEVKGLGNNILAAIEKEDHEALTLLRAKHEAIILSISETVKYQQWQETLKSLEGLHKSFANAVQRYTYYERLLGRGEGDISVPEADKLDQENLEGMDYAQEEHALTFREIEVDVQSTTERGEKVAEDTLLNEYELNELKQSKAATVHRSAAARKDMIASALSLIPQLDTAGEPVGVGTVVSFGGVQLSKMMGMTASAERIAADILSYSAGHSAKIGSYKRREQDWAFQSNLAAGEINQIYKQIRAAQIRVQIAKREYENHKTQLKFSQEIEQFLRGEEVSVGDRKHKKLSTSGFYAWMKREVKGLHSQFFQFAFDIAKKAERALQHELGEPAQSYLKYGYLAGKEGLLAGEKLFLDIKRMEMAYHDLNTREYELTKSISLMQVDPLALIQLRATGSCTVALPEALFDMDCPGHYFRRIKSVALSIPCVTGPYSSVNCTLTLRKSSIRKNAQLENDRYERTGSEDPRFSDHFGSMQSIITSSAQNDSGLFETNLHDERYLPFENSGVISEWGLELPANPSKSELCQFDYGTISDVILHIRYTAREGGKPLRTSALTHLSQLIDKAEAAGSTRLFSVRHEFPSAWTLFKGIEMGAGTFAPLTIELREEHYPFWAKGHLEAVVKVEILAKTTDGIDIFEDIDEDGAGTGRSDSLSQKHLGNLYGSEIDILPASPIGPYTLYFSSNEIEDLWLALTFGEKE